MPPGCDIAVLCNEYLQLTMFVHFCVRFFSYAFSIENFNLIFIVVSHHGNFCYDEMYLFRVVTDIIY